MKSLPSPLPSRGLSLSACAAAILLAAAGCGQAESTGNPSDNGNGDTGRRDAGSDSAGDLAADTALGFDASTDTSAPDAAETSDLADDGSPAPVTLRLIHMAAGAPEIEVRLNNEETPFVESLGYGEATAPVPVRPGTHVISVRSINGHVGSGILASTGEMTLPAGSAVTVLVVTASDQETGMGLQLLTETAATPPAGRALVRFVHSSPDLPPLHADLYGDGNRDLGSVAPYDATAAAGAAVRANESFEVRLSTDEPAPRAVGGFVMPAVDSGESVLVIAAGYDSRPPRAEDGLVLWLVGETDVRGPVRQNPLVWVLNAVPDAPSLDLFRNGRELTDGLGYGELAGPVEIWPRTYSIDLYPHEWGLSDAAPPVDQAPLGVDEWTDLRAGYHYLAVATGYLQEEDEEPFNFMLLRASFEDDELHGRLRILHAAPRAPELQAWAEAYGADPATALDGELSFGDATEPEGLPVPPGPLAISLSAEEAVHAEVRLVVSAGLRAFLVIADAALPEAAEQALIEVFVVTATADGWQLSAPERLD